MNKNKTFLLLIFLLLFKTLILSNNIQKENKIILLKYKEITLIIK